MPVHGQHCIVTDRIRETVKRALNWFPSDTISLCKCGLWCKLTQCTVHVSVLCASLTMHCLSITSFSEKIGSGETHECNDGAPLFRLMDCSPGAILRDSGSVTRQPAIKLRTSNHHFILFGITIEFVVCFWRRSINYERRVKLVILDRFLSYYKCPGMATWIKRH